MSPTVILLGLCFAILCGVVSSSTDAGDTLALQAFKTSLVDGSDNLGNWRGDDPCGGWTGIYCAAPDYPSSLTGSNVSHVTELRLLQFNLGGQMAPEIGNLSALKYLDLMWNQISGSIPTTIGNLKNLNFLLLSGNQFSGAIPQELGLLPSLTRLQLDQNMLSGPIPTTFLDKNLPNIQHMNLNNNSLDGGIPSEVATLSTVHYLLLDNNQLTGTLPAEIASLPKVLIIQLDNNRFDSNATIPAEYGSIPQLVKLSLRNCNLRGSIPDFSLSVSLAVLDLSHNLLSGPIPNTSLSVNLTTLDLSYNLLSGIIPENVGSIPALLFLELRQNNISGLIPSNLGTGERFFENITKVVDFQDNLITGFDSGSNLLTLQSEGYTRVWLSGNPFCMGAASSNSQQNNPLCVSNDVSALLDVGAVTRVSFPLQSSCAICPAPYSLAPAPSSQLNNCSCKIPISVELRLKSPGFGVVDPYLLEFIAYLASGLNLAVDQVQVKEYVYQPGPRFLFTLLFFSVATESSFNDSEVNRVYGDFADWNIPTNNTFGPYELISFLPPEEVNKKTSHHGHGGITSGDIAGIVIGVLAFVVLKSICMFYCLRAWITRSTKASTSERDLNSGIGKSRRLGPVSQMKRKSHSTIKVTGVKSFTYEEMAQATDGFSGAKLVGQGGYGKVYSGVLEDGQKVAIKRAEEASHQGSHEFETEILLLSRVHHRNLVSLIGYCNDDDQQMLVYEFIANGSLQYHLSTSSQDPLNFVVRLQIALGSARGIHYLHTQADPPIYHRDVKASNILLNEHFHAKVADFGLSKLAPQPNFEGTIDNGYISTVVKGTPGYLDPEYFKTHRLTDKSDVYSFGVLLLVLFTGLQPISEGKNLVREVNLVTLEGNLSTIVDPRISRKYPPGPLESLIHLALSCCRDAPNERPSIAEVVAHLEQVWKKTYTDLTSGRDLEDKDFIAFTAELLGNTSEDYSFIEIDPSQLSSSAVSSRMWTDSNQGSTCTNDVAIHINTKILPR